MAATDPPTTSPATGDAPGAVRLRLEPPADPTVAGRVSTRYPDVAPSYLEAITEHDPTGVVLGGINVGPRRVEGRRYDLLDALVSVNDARFSTYLDGLPPVDELLEVGSIGADPVLVAMAGAKEHEAGAVYRWSASRPDEGAERVGASYGDVLRLAARVDELVVDTTELRVTQRAARARLDLLLDAWEDPATRTWWRRRVLLDLDAVAADHREPW